MPSTPTSASSASMSDLSFDAVSHGEAESSAEDAGMAEHPVLFFRDDMVTILVRARASKPCSYSTSRQGREDNVPHPALLSEPELDVLCADSFRKQGAWRSVSYQRCRCVQLCVCTSPLCAVSPVRHTVASFVRAPLIGAQLTRHAEGANPHGMDGRSSSLNQVGLRCDPLSCCKVDI
jgi:hypothetical protein